MTDRYRAAIRVADRAWLKESEFNHGATPATLLAVAVRAVVDEALAERDTAAARADQAERMLRTMDHWAEVAERVERRNNELAAERDTAVADLAALRARALSEHTTTLGEVLRAIYADDPEPLLQAIVNRRKKEFHTALTGEGPAGAGTEPDTEPIPDHATCPACSLRVRVLYLDQRPVYEFHRRLTVNSGVCSASGKPFPAPRGAAEGPQPDPPRGWLCGSDGSCAPGACSECEP